MDKKLKILVLSNTPWADDNSFGNSFSGIFGGMDGIEIANIYCRHGAPDNNVVERYFRITEKSLLKNLFNRKHPPGREVLKSEPADSPPGFDEKAFGLARIYRFQLFFWLRDLIWIKGRWRCPELEKFIDDFNPGVIFQPVYYSNYLNRIALFLKEFTGSPMAGYISDDVYTLRQFSLSPLFWINRFMVRPKVRRVVAECGRLYVISGMQKREYENIFGKECRVITKGADFSGEPPAKKELNTPLRMVYTGNIGSGRWKTLSLISGVLAEINREKPLAELHIYTKSPVSAKMRKKLETGGSSHLKGGISFSEVIKVQDDADIVVYAEPFSLKERLIFRLSFSTKLVDYFSSARCIFAAGHKDIASIRHLLDNDAAVAATEKHDIKPKLLRLLNDDKLIREYSVKAWECGKRNHRIDEIQKSLRHDLVSLAEK